MSCIGDGLPSGETRWCVEPSKLRSHNKWVRDATKDCWSNARSLALALTTTIDERYDESYRRLDFGSSPAERWCRRRSQVVARATG